MMTVTVALVLAASACGGSSGGSAKRNDTSNGARPVNEWIGTLCSSVATWRTAVTDASTRLTSQIGAGVTNVDSAKAAVGSTLDASVSATDALIAALNRNGSPDVKNGAQIEQKVVGSFQSGRQVFVDARARVNTLPSDPVAFAGQASQIVSSIQSGFSSFGTAFEQAQKLDADQKITEAGNKNAACKQLASA
jgi:hypothetical protein